MSRVPCAALPVLILLVPAAGLAGDKRAPPPKKVPALDLGLGKIGGALPDTNGIERPKAQTEGISPKVTTSDVHYEVLSVQHAYDFTRTTHGIQPVGDLLTAIALYGQPPTTQKFTTWVRVKASGPVSATIEMAILDSRGDTAMSGNGELNFKGAKDGEVDWLIDWAPVARPHGGTWKVLVRIAGQPMGTWPLQVIEEKR
ncbi:MAG: hypothetical protein IRZ16_06580 [Myxococcaceae bacterium]|nr:hypothetical protein [Myxococcaceae bacterium]